MKLLHYTNRKLSMFLFLLMGIWGIFFYFTIIDEVMDETDDTLANYREILVGKILADSTLLNTEDQILHSYLIHPITPKEAERYHESFYDSKVYIETEDEFEPVRVMKSCFRASDLNFYELEIRLSTLERDDLIQTIFWYLIALYAILLVCTMMGTRLVLKKIFLPLDRLLDWLGKVSPDRPAPTLSKESPIQEFRTLNQAALDMHLRAEKTYQEQKQFIENASHELQTPLSIIQGKLELLAENENLNEKELRTIDEIYRSLNRVVQLNKSLLLLSRIHNGQFPETTLIHINEHIHQLMDILPEIYENKQLHYQLEEKGNCVVRMNESLAQALLNNLLKNAIVHSPDQGNVYIRIEPDRLEIANSGTEALDAHKMFSRFYKGKSTYKDSVGLGLSIIRSITEIYHIHLEYSFDGATHHFMLNFVK